MPLVRNIPATAQSDSNRWNLGSDISTSPGLLRPDPVNGQMTYYTSTLSSGFSYSNSVGGQVTPWLIISVLHADFIWLLRFHQVYGAWKRLGHSVEGNAYTKRRYFFSNKLLQKSICGFRS